jgi:hypothetical protein
LKCVCHKPPLSYQDFNSSFLGVDETNGRFSTVTIETCKHCKTKWVNYLVEIESFSNSSKWYRGILSKDFENIIRPENVIKYLEKLEFYLFGGSYFNSTGQYGSGIIHIDF